MNESSAKWKWEVFVKLITSIGFIATIFYGYYEYKMNEKAKQQEQLFEEEQNLRYRQFELYKTFWEKRFEVYVDTCNSAATLSTFMSKVASNRDFAQVVANKPQSNFWQLYYGALSIVEDKHVEVALFDFGQALKKCEQKVNRGEQPTVQEADVLKKQSLLLGLACRDSIREYWKTLEDIDRVKLSEFEKK